MGRASAAGAAALFCLLSLSPPSFGRTPDRASLVVQINIDQLASIYLARWGSLLNGGFARLRRNGATYPNGVHAQANTATGPGHATIATGAWPDVHGIVSNKWFDPKTGAQISCVGNAPEGPSPMNLMAPTIADSLKLATNGKSKVVSIAGKDRAAVLTGGYRPTAAIWFDVGRGTFVSGRWYGAPAPAWMESTVAPFLPATIHQKAVWDRLMPKLSYVDLAGADDNHFETPAVGLGRTFPHRYGDGVPANDPDWLDVYLATPPSVDAVLALAKRAVVEEKLGKGGVVDMLIVGFSSLDYSGHYFGTDAQETLDILLRIDLAIADLMQHVEAQNGSGKTLWVVTGDHGIMNTPEAVKAVGVRAERVGQAPLRESVDAALAKLAKKGKAPLKLGLIDTPLVWLTRTGEPETEEERSAARRAAAEALAQHPAIAEARAVNDVASISEAYRAMYQRLLYPGRLPDVLVRARPYALIDYSADGKGHGTNHGSPYTYDTHVPIILAGPGVQGGEDPTPVEITRVAPTIAAWIGIPPPAAAHALPLPAVRP